jgi:hypothetical protein
MAKIIPMLLTEQLQKMINETPIAGLFSSATVIFADIAGFMCVKQDSSVAEFTKSQSLAASAVTASPGDSTISTGYVESRMSKQSLEKRPGGQTACVLL